MIHSEAIQLIKTWSECLKNYYCIYVDFEEGFPGDGMG